MKVLWVFLLTALTAGLAGPAFASDAGFGVGDACQSQWIRDYRNGPGLLDAGFPLDVTGSGVEWQVSPPVGQTAGWWDIEIGDAYDTPATGSGMLTCYGFPVVSGFVDWTGYTSFTLSFTNCSLTDWFMADVVVNTGWTNSPYYETDNQYTSGWTWIAPGQTLAVTVDLAAAVNLNHVSNISFKLGTNYGNSNWYDGTHICTTVAPGDYVAPDPTGLCISTATPCVTVPVDLVQSSGSTVRGTSVTLQLSPELELCGAGIQPGPLFSNPPWGSATPYFYVLDNGNGSYTVDYSILGLACGPTTGGQLFTLDVGASALAGVDDVGTITVTEVIVRDCDNGPVDALPGLPASIPIDRSGPDAVVDLLATQVKTGNDADGTTGIQLSWSTPGDAVQVEVYRAPFGNYPEYDDPPGAGSAPVAPAYPPSAPWALTAVTASGAVDEVAVRDFWYYAIYTQDGCGNWSAVSNRTDGTLNYHLGDVSGIGGPGNGDNLVGTIDISLLGAHYGITLAAPDPVGYLDVGPTTDSSTNGRPTTDNAIQFEDLIIFAINYGAVSKPVARPLAADRNEVALQVGELPGEGGRFDAVIRLASDGSIQGVSVPLVWNAAVVEPVEMIAGDFLDRQSGPAQAFAPRAGAVDAAVFGSTFAGEGELAKLTFRVIGAGEPGIALGEVQARDAENHRVELKLTTERGDRGTLPAITRLLPCAPNPFLGATAITFTLAEAGPVKLQIYSVGGRLVRTLQDEWTAAGVHEITWNGLDRAGREVASGSYLIKMTTSDRSETQRVIRLR
jgi:hypothetical protein